VPNKTSFKGKCVVEFAGSSGTYYVGRTVFYADVNGLVSVVATANLSRIRWHFEDSSVAAPLLAVEHRSPLKASAIDSNAIRFLLVKGNVTTTS